MVRKQAGLKALALAAVALVLGAMYSCTTLQLDLPAVTTSQAGQHLPGKVIWHDLVTEDPEAAQRFYGGLFGWQFKPLPGGYTLIYDGDRSIGGMVDARRFDTQGKVSQWVVVISVTDVEHAASVVTSAGGKIHGGPIAVGERGHLMLVADPQGAMVALLQTKTGDPPDRDAEIGEFMWNELWTSDPVSATAFYSELFDYQPAKLELADGSSYQFLESQGMPRVAVMANPIVGLAPTWVAYVRVADVSATSARVLGLGGQLMLRPQRNPIGGELAIIKDPSGAGLVMQTWNRSRQEVAL